MRQQGQQDTLVEECVSAVGDCMTLGVVSEGLSNITEIQGGTLKVDIDTSGVEAALFLILVILVGIIFALDNISRAIKELKK